MTLPQPYDLMRDTMVEQEFSMSCAWQSSAAFLRYLSRLGVILSVAGILHACGDDITGPGDLEPDQFKAILSGGMQGTVTGSVNDFVSTVEGETQTFRALEFTGRFPDDEEHGIFVAFDALDPSSGAYSVHPDWTPQDPGLGPEEVGVFFDDSQSHVTHHASTGTLDVDVADELQGELTATLVPLDSGVGQEIEAEVLFRVD